MEYRKLGKWGIRVSEVGLGSWLTYGGSVEEKNSIAQIHYAYERGINFFDTANVYAGGEGERVVGKALKAFRRDKVVLATKVYFPMDDGPNDKGLSRKHIFEQCHHSLKRLDTDYIDLYQCHRFDSEVPMYEIVRAMDDLIRQGKILYWGVSEWGAQHIEDAVATAQSLHAMPPVSNQPRYNMLQRDIEQSVIPTSSRLGLGQVVFSPLAQGILTGKYKSGHPHPKDSRAANDKVNMFIMRDLNANNLSIVQQLESIAKEMDLTVAQLALAWILRLPEISSVIVGATKQGQIDENIKASGVKLSEQLVKRIEEILTNAVRV